MELFGWFKKKQPKVRAFGAAEQTPVKFIKPPTVMTILREDQICVETPTQFLHYGWRHGEESQFANAWDVQLKHGHKMLPDAKIHSMAIPLPNGLWLRAASYIDPLIDERGAHTALILFLPGSLVYEDMPKMDSITGGPTQELSDAIRYIALRMESRIMSVFTDCDTGEVLVVFKSWRPDYTIHNNEQRWSNAQLVTDTTIKKESDQP